jgi:hypothetical protein
MRIDMRSHISALALAFLTSPVLVAGSAEVQEKPAHPDPPEPAPPALPQPEREAPMRNCSVLFPIEPYPVPMAMDPPRPRRRSKRGQRSAGRKWWMR